MNLGYDHDALRKYVECQSDGAFTLAAPQSAVTAPLPPCDQQLDLDGRLHDVEPQNEPQRLFSPAPNQLVGQTFIRTDTEEER